MPFGLISFLWLVWFGLLPATFVAILITGESHWSRFWWVSSALLSVCAWLNWAFHRRDCLGLACGWMAAGMTFGMLADFYGAVKVLRFTEPLTIVIPLFALGHVSYIAGLVILAHRLGWTGRATWRGVWSTAVVLYNLLGLAIWVTLVYPSNALPGMHGPTAGYTVFLATAAATMATVAFFDKRFLAVGIGGALFLVSDGFLAVRLFQENWHGIGDLCWITYGVGQMLIVFGTIAGTHESVSPST
ncbi:MAG: hypothetical protein JW829_08630 [Pirellulales bacterium]|nr:hypothetical protein [Pirellulales bacterium]